MIGPLIVVAIGIALAFIGAKQVARFSEKGELDGLASAPWKITDAQTRAASLLMAGLVVFAAGVLWLVTHVV